MSSVVQSRRWGEPGARVVVTAWQRTGKPMSVFAREHGLVVQRISRWARLGRTPSSTSRSSRRSGLRLGASESIGTLGWSAWFTSGKCRRKSGSRRGRTQRRIGEGVQRTLDTFRGTSSNMYTRWGSTQREVPGGSADGRGRPDESDRAKLCRRLAMRARGDEQACRPRSAAPAQSHLCA